MKCVAIIATSLLLAACATAMVKDLEEGLASLMGKSEQVAFATLGQPSDRQRSGTDTLYTWTSSRSGRVVLPQNTSGAWDVTQTSPFKTTMYSQTAPVTYICSIRLAADQNGILKAWSQEGGVEGCGPYVQSLKQR